jgi:hypothetical protein
MSEATISKKCGLLMTLSAFRDSNFGSSRAVIATETSPLVHRRRKKLGADGRQLLMPANPAGEALKALAPVARKFRDPASLRDLRSASGATSLYDAMTL